MFYVTITIWNITAIQIVTKKCDILYNTFERPCIYFSKNSFTLKRLNIVWSELAFYEHATNIVYHVVKLFVEIRFIVFCLFSNYHDIPPKSFFVLRIVYQVSASHGSVNEIRLYVTQAVIYVPLRQKDIFNYTRAP